MATIETKRTPQDKDEELLVSCGWEPRGISLWEYPLNDAYRGHYTKEAALELTREEGLDVYCPLCGSCGEEECCRPEMCKCFYADHYNKTYRQLSDEHEAFYRLVKQIADIQNDEGFIGKYIRDARAILEDYGYDSE